MNRAWHRAISLCAAALFACGPGDHEMPGFNSLFGGGAAGKKAVVQRPADTGSDDGANLAVDGIGAAGQPGDSGVSGSVRVGNGTGGVAAPGPGAAGVGTGSAAAGTGASHAPTGTATAGTSSASGNPGAASACEPGHVSVAGQCVCDLNGTFAFHGTAPVTLASMASVEALNDTMDLWGIVRQVYDADGKLGLTLHACGQTTPDICTAAQAPVLPTAEAYAQYVPVEVWDKDAAPAVAQMSLPGALPGAAFDTPTLAELFGVTLANPLGAWPTTRKDIEGGSEFDGSAVNGAHWADIDGDGQLGMSVKLVPPGGAPATPTSGPPHSYAATSSKCPRTDPQAARSAYAYLPLPQGLGVKRIKRLYSAQRVTLEFHGTLSTCDRLSGTLTGAKAGALRMDALIGGCAMVNGSGESACTSTQLDMTDSGGGATAGLTLGTGKFAFARVADSVTCAEVRAMNLE
jgi:hypothetical protein